MKLGRRTLTCYRGERWSWRPRDYGGRYYGDDWRAWYVGRLWICWRPKRLR